MSESSESSESAADKSAPADKSVAANKSAADNKSAAANIKDADSVKPQSTMKAEQQSTSTKSEASPASKATTPAAKAKSSNKTSVKNEVKTQDKLLDISAELEQCIRDGQRLLTYISRNGSAQLDPSLTESIIDAKRYLVIGQWTVAQEQQYLVNYDKLAKSVFPVTVESINAIIPDKISKNPDVTKAQKAVAWYRRYTLVALVMMLLAQLYWLMGNELRTNLDKKFAAREQTNEQILKMSKDKEQQAELQKKLTIQDQEFDANYNLLKAWNLVWMVGSGFEAKLPPYFQAQYDHQKQRVTNNDNKPDVDKQELIGELDLKRKLHEVRVVYFENLLAADFVLNSFQGYILPLLYGLLGAFIYVLRSLMGEIKSLTYSYDSEIRYRLRLTLGALGGMIIGWFLKPDEAGAVASLSPMALAFLMGYNVDLLFTLMDKLIDNMKRSIEKSDNNQATTSAK